MWKLFEVAYVCSWSKIIFCRACIKEDDVLTFFILGFIFDHIFDPKKDKLPCPVFFPRGGMFNAKWDLVLYLKSDGLSIPWKYPSTTSFQYFITVFTIQYSTLPLTKSQFIFQNFGKGKYIFLSFLKFGFSLKKETMRNIYDQNVAELARCIIVLYTGVRYLLCWYKNLFGIFFRDFEAIDSLVNIRAAAKMIRCNSWD